jgi:hypothetical protein
MKVWFWDGVEADSAEAGDGDEMIGCGHEVCLPVVRAPAAATVRATNMTAAG